MITVCSWHKSETPFVISDDGEGDMVSHGICQQCADAYVNEEIEALPEPKFDPALKEDDFGSAYSEYDDKCNCGQCQRDREDDQAAY